MVRWVLTLLFIGFLAYFVHWTEVRHIVQRADAPILLLAAITYFADRVLTAYKWGLLLRVQGVRIPLVLNVGINSAAPLVGMVLPVTVGADALRVLWLSRLNIPTVAVASSIVFERLIGFAVAVLAAIVGLTYLLYQTKATGPLTDVVWLLVAIAILVIGVLLTSFSAVTTKRLGRLLRPFSSWKPFKLLQKVHEAYGCYRNAWRYVIPFVALTVLRQMLSVGGNYVIAAALQIKVEPVELLAAVAVTVLLSRLPITFDGIGIYEGVLMLLLMPLGLNAEDVLAIAVVFRILIVVSSAPGAVAAFMTLGLRVDEVRKHRKEVSI